MDYLVSVPAVIHVTVEAENAEAITADMVNQAVLDQHGKHPQLDKDAWDAEDDFSVLGETGQPS